MDTRLGYIGGGISLILAFFPENNWIKATWAGIGIFAFIAAYIFHGRKSLEIDKTAKNEKPLGVPSPNISIINGVKPNNGELLSAPLAKKHVWSQSQELSNKQEPFELSPNHIAILKVFRSNDGELASVPLIEHITGLEKIVINSILDEIAEHKLINATNLDEYNGGWQYQLTALGRKTALKLT